MAVHTCSCQPHLPSPQGGPRRRNTLEAHVKPDQIHATLDGRVPEEVVEALAA